MYNKKGFILMESIILFMIAVMIAIILSNLLITISMYKQFDYDITEEIRKIENVYKET